MKESFDGSAHINSEPRGEDLPILKVRDGFLSFSLPEGTTLEKAEEIAQFMNDNLLAVSCTTFR